MIKTRQGIRSADERLNLLFKEQPIVAISAVERNHGMGAQSDCAQRAIVRQACCRLPRLSPVAHPIE